MPQQQFRNLSFAVTARTMLPVRFTASARTLFSGILWVIGAFFLLSGIASAQTCTNLCLQQVTCPNNGTTTITGTVYDPRSVNPLPNVLVYIPNAPVAAFTPGVQCLQAGSPVSGSPLVSTNSAVDGTFVLTNVPVGSNIPLVIQAGKWRRQFVIPTVTACTNTAMSPNPSMPQTQAQGDIPQIAIVTGSVDALECILRKVGIADSEFTDPGGTGSIQFFKGSGAAGAQIDSNTPSETTLVSSPTTLNNYDMVMFPCQGAEYSQTSTNQSNLISYANIGGRVFATHFSYVWLYNDAPFSGVADWDVNQSDPSATSATINTSFTGGMNLAQWLQKTGATTTLGQVTGLTEVRHDVNTLISPTQSWLNINESSIGSPTMQLTFNTPVGATAANQCGRVLFNDYHVEDPSYIASGSTNGYTFPTECQSATTTMTAQEKMLEYGLFDLSTFVTPVVAPTVTVGFTNSPATFAQGDSADTITVNVTNTSLAGSTPLNASVVLTVGLPAGLTATGMTDPTGGWICIVSTLTCTRTTGIDINTSDLVTLTVSVAGNASVSGLSVTAILSGGGLSSNVTGQTTIPVIAGSVISWATPAPIVYGTALGGALDATALNNGTTVPGSFTYTATPAGGSTVAVTGSTILLAGSYTLGVSFTPTDTVHYTPATGTTQLTVLQATPTLTLTSSAPSVFLLNPVTFTATAAFPVSTPTGTVSFYDGTTLIGSGTLSAAGVTSVITASLTAGQHSAITAVYNGDSNFLPLTSAPLAQLVQDFSLTNGATTSTTIRLNSTTTYPFQITPLNGSTFPAAIQLSVTGTSPGAVITFTPIAIASGLGTTTFTMQVQDVYLVQPVQSRNHTPPSKLAPLSLALLLVPIFARRRSKLTSSLRVGILLLAGLGLVASATGCGYSEPVRKSYVMTVTATAGPLTHSTTVTLNVD
jgi:hypothetical protein